MPEILVHCYVKYSQISSNINGCVVTEMSHIKKGFRGQFCKGYVLKWEVNSVDWRHILILDRFSIENVEVTSKEKWRGGEGREVRDGRDEKWKNNSED